jgi:hypothetical protein
VGLPERAAQTATTKKTRWKARAGRGGQRVLPQHPQVHGRSSVHAQTHGKRANRQYFRAAAQKREPLTL